MATSNWYNGYSPQEREKKFRRLKQLLARGGISQPTGPCNLCGDPDVQVEYHDEDYGEPYIWEPPALFCLCRPCHRVKLHQRFGRPSAWFAFIAHVRRGGYARDLKKPDVKREIDAYRAAIDVKRPLLLESMRPYRKVIGTEWFANLSLDTTSLTRQKARRSSE